MGIEPCGCPTAWRCLTPVLCPYTPNSLPPLKSIKTLREIPPVTIHLSETGTLFSKGHKNPCEASFELIFFVEANKNMWNMCEKT